MNTWDADFVAKWEADRQKWEADRQKWEADFLAKRKKEYIEETASMFKRCAVHDNYMLSIENLGTKRGEPMDGWDLEAAVKGLRRAAAWLEKHGEKYTGDFTEIKN